MYALSASYFNVNIIRLLSISLLLFCLFSCFFVIMIENEKLKTKRLKHVIMMTEKHDLVTYDYYDDDDDGDGGDDNDDDDDDDGDDLIFSSVSLESLYAAELEP